MLGSVGGILPDRGECYSKIVGNVDGDLRGHSLLRVADKEPGGGKVADPNSLEAPRVASVARPSTTEATSHSAWAARLFGEGTRHGWLLREGHFPFDSQFEHVPARSDGGKDNAPCLRLFN
jgi:hypothetical protein